MLAKVSDKVILPVLFQSVSHTVFEKLLLTLKPYLLALVSLKIC